MARARRLLGPFAWLFGAAVAARNSLYERGLLAIESVGTPVISVGNITTGGTGKTPLVEAIAGILLGAGMRPAVLSRGYGRSTTGTLTVSDGESVIADADAAGDEPAQMAGKLRGCAVVVDEDRVRGARFIESSFRSDAIILDDGFQHRALHRDLDIVVLGPGPEPLLPAGNAREPESSLRRAGLVVLTGGRTEPPGPAGGAPAVRMSYEISAFNGPVPAGGLLAAEGFVAFCGIGNPGSFRDLLGSKGLAPAAFLAFPDHRKFDAADLDRIEEARRSAGAKYVVTTEKDAVRLAGASRLAAPFRDALVTVVVRAVFPAGGPVLEAAVLRAARKGAA